MNAKQQKTIENLREAILENSARTRLTDVKRESVEDHGSFVAFQIEVGLPNDEGTAAILCRERRNLHIGPRGGITLANARRRANCKGFFNAVHARVYR